MSSSSYVSSCDSCCIRRPWLIVITIVIPINCLIMFRCCFLIISLVFRMCVVDLSFLYVVCYCCLYGCPCVELSLSVFVLCIFMCATYVSYYSYLSS